MDLLRDLQREQSEAVATIDWQGQRRELGQLNDLGDLALKTMGRVSTSFELNRASIGG